MGGEESDPDGFELRTGITQHDIRRFERLADFLIDLANTDNSKASITLPIDKSLIAAELGMQPETFSRALVKLKSVGVKKHRSRCNDRGYERTQGHGEVQRRYLINHPVERPPRSESLLGDG